MAARQLRKIEQRQISGHYPAFSPRQQLPGAVFPFHPLGQAADGLFGILHFQQGFDNIINRSLTQRLLHII
ncbi:hypothetical protein D3C79_1102950 [compost metagenome]